MASTAAMHFCRSASSLGKNTSPAPNRPSRAAPRRGPPWPPSAGNPRAVRPKSPRHRRYSAHTHNRRDAPYCPASPAHRARSDARLTLQVGHKTNATTILLIGRIIETLLLRKSNLSCLFAHVQQKCMERQRCRVVSDWVLPLPEPGIPHRPLGQAPTNSLRKKGRIFFHSTKKEATFKFLILFIRQLMNDGSWTRVLNAGSVAIPRLAKRLANSITWKLICPNETNSGKVSQDRCPKKNHNRKPLKPRRLRPWPR